jgi:hypothetical protein
MAAELPRRAAIAVWGNLPRDVQGAVRSAMKGRNPEREDLARLLHNRHPGPSIRRSRVR